MTAEPATVTNLPAVTSAPVPFNERDAFELALRRARVYAASTLVPEQYRDNLPNCLIALNMAKRIGADELMVMQHLYVVQGKPGWSGQFLIATFNQCGRFTSMKFEWQGDPNSKAWSCRAYATEKATGEKIVGAWVTWKMVEAEGWSKKAGSKWLTMPEVMATYRAGAFIVRAYAPEIAMGLPTVEELRDVIDVDVEPQPTKTAAVTAALKAKLAPEPPRVEQAEPPADTLPTAANLKEIADEVMARGKPKGRQTKPDVSEAGVMDDMQRATNRDTLDAAATLIDALPDPEARDRCILRYHERVAELAQ